LRLRSLLPRLADAHLTDDELRAEWKAEGFSDGDIDLVIASRTATVRKEARHDPRPSLALLEARRIKAGVPDALHPDLVRWLADFHQRHGSYDPAHVATADLALWASRAPTIDLPQLLVLSSASMKLRKPP
jgi:hypothetical protein